MQCDVFGVVIYMSKFFQIRVFFSNQFFHFIYPLTCNRDKIQVHGNQVNEQTQYIMLHWFVKIYERNLNMLQFT